MAQRTCENCGTEFNPKRKDSRACGPKCSKVLNRYSKTRRCDAADCDRPVIAKGCCKTHYRQLHRSRQAEYHDRTCVTCDEPFRSSRKDGKFCSDACKGLWYSDTMRTKCLLPSHHPVMRLIAEARKPRPKPPKPDHRTARECPACGCWFSPLLHSSARTMTTCSRRCTHKMSRRRRRARERGAVGGTWRWSDFMRIARKFNYCCAYCGEKPDRLDPDHVVPLARGGLDAPSNLLPACRWCNSSKHTRTLSEWAEWLASNGRPPRATSWAPEDKRYRHLTQILLTQDISPAA